MERIAADGLVSICEEENSYSILEVNSETDFVAKNDEFINFCEEVSKISLKKSGNMEDIFTCGNSSHSCWKCFNIHSWYIVHSINFINGKITK